MENLLAKKYYWLIIIVFYSFLSIFSFTFIQKNNKSFEYKITAADIKIAVNRVINQNKWWKYKGTFADIINLSIDPKNSVVINPNGSMFINLLGNDLETGQVIVGSITILGKELTPPLVIINSLKDLETKVDWLDHINSTNLFTNSQPFVAVEAIKTIFNSVIASPKEWTFSRPDLKIHGLVTIKLIDSPNPVIEDPNKNYEIYFYAESAIKSENQTKYNYILVITSNEITKINLNMPFKNILINEFTNAFVKKPINVINLWWFWTIIIILFLLTGFLFFYNHKLIKKGWKKSIQKLSNKKQTLD